MMEAHTVARHLRKPPWLNKKIDGGTHALIHDHIGGLQLNTICKEARCPNITECFRNRQATFLILGNACTRQCLFCGVGRSRPSAPDPSEPGRVAEAVKRLGLKHAVITSPTRDDLPDGGAAYFAMTVRAVRDRCPSAKIELLVPDFQGDENAIRAVCASGPDIVGHNMETVRRLYFVRKGADYDRSLAVIRYLSSFQLTLAVKSGFMAGMGETAEETKGLVKDLYSAGCRHLSAGQYLAPSLGHYPVQAYHTPEYFGILKAMALEEGFDHVESGPYVRSSYHADQYLNEEGQDGKI